MAVRKPKVRQARDIPHLTSRLFGVPLLIDERKIDQIYPVFEAKILTGQLPQKTDDDDDYREPGEFSLDAASGVATIPIIGSLVRRSSWLNSYSGLTAYPEVAECLDNALADARVRAILLQVDSFGGEAGGCFELCKRIYDARSIKPIWAVADIDALSAGYAILSSAQRCFVSSRGSVGSIGVVSVHLERSRQNEMMGLTYTVFRAGARKADFNPYEKLAPEAAAKQLASMDRTRQAFVDTVARNRPISPEAIFATEGQWYDADDGISLGLVDGIDTFENVFLSLVKEVAPGAEAVAKPPETPPEPPCDPPADDDDETEGVIMETKPAETTAAAAEPATAEVVTLADVRPNEAAAQIANLCLIAGAPQKAATFIAQGKTVKQVQDALIEARASQDGGELHNHHTGTGNGGINMTGPATKDNNGPPKPETLAGWDKAFASAHASNPHFQQAARR